MIKTGRIRDISGDTVTLIEEKSEACFGCMNRECGRPPQTFRAGNPRRLSLSPGQTVEAEIPPSSLVREALLSLLPPILGFMAAYALTGLLFSTGEAVGGVAGLFGTAFLLYRLRRRFPPRARCRILRVVDGAADHCLFGKI
jgi:sigma-E factor negative regulatory protein RseC